MTRLKMLIPQSLASAAIIVLLAACTTPHPRLDPGGETYDGMVPVRDSGLREAWVRPGIDIRSYRQVMLLPVEVQYRAVRDRGFTSLSRSDTTEFPMSDADKQRLVDTVTEVFRDELSKGRSLALATQPGPDVLQAKVTLLDVVSRMPPEGPGRTDIYLDEIGAATPVLELKDSMSGETLARAVDRRKVDAPAGPGGPNTLSRVTPVTAWSEVRRVARRWASTVTQLIDQLHALGPLPAGSPEPAGS